VALNRKKSRRRKTRSRRARRAKRKIEAAEVAVGREARVKNVDGQESLDQFSSRVRQAFTDQFRKSETDYDTWVRDVWPGHVVGTIDGDHYAISFSETEDGEISFDSDRSNWTKVEERYIPISEALALKLAEADDDDDEEKRGTEWEVTIIGPDEDADVVTEGGVTYVKSKNGRLYSADALKASVPLFEGVKVYDNHLTDEEFEAKQGMRSIKEEWVGVIVETYFDKTANAVKGTLKVIDAKLRKKLVEAHDADVLSSIGLSIDALGDGATRAIKALGGATMQVVEKITKALSVDVVADPAAGGRLARLIAAQTPYKEVTEMKPEELKKLMEETLDEKVGPINKRLEALEAEDEIKASEAAIELAEKHDIDLSEVEATGDDGYITEADVQRFVDSQAGDEDDEPAGDADAEPKPAEGDAAAEAVAAAKRAEAAADKAEAREKSLAMKAAQSELVETLAESGLPKPTRSVIAEQFKDSIYNPKDLEAAIESHRTMLSELSESGQVRIPENHNIDVSPVTPWDEYEMSFLRLLAGPTGFSDIVTKAKAEKDKAEVEQDPYAPQRFSEAIGRYVEAGMPAFPKPVRLSEWFYDLMGGLDAAIDGKMKNSRLTEAAVTTSSVSSIVKNAVNLMLAADYSVRERWWEPLVRQEDVDTLDDSTLIRVYGMAGLNVMSEGDTYQEMAWSDEEETAAFVKRGGYIGVTLETFLRDKINILRSIPRRMSNAWYNEISDLVSNVFTVNTAAGPVLADTGALFNATAIGTAGGHVNLLTTALSYASYIAARTAMRIQTDQPLGAGKRLNIAPKYLLVPADIENVAEQIRVSELVPSQIGGGETTSPGQEFQTANTLRGAFETIVVPNWSDADNWALVADPAMFPAIYLIWLRGRRTPELFAADDERAGAMFTNDEIRYKVRMFGSRFSSTYDCAPVADFRPLHKSNV
jgi:pyruvate/2-oxoglutarate dehydrogenase complex dihydrolipoamide acyltransferase (E2) component